MRSENGEFFREFRVKVIRMKTRQRPFTSPGRRPSSGEQLAIRRRDPRFDGRFFMGVRTTGIYCRPICPATPLMKNIEIFERAAQAENSGYRPCRRCRPESAPASPAWQGSAAVVARALKVLSHPDYTPEAEEDFAARFGVTGRHLRRLFERELGVTPRRLGENLRLNFARKLLRETAMPVVQVAHASGFGSLRRFNQAYRDRFAASPREERGRESRRESGETQKRRRPFKSAAEGHCLRLAYRPPLDWQHTLNFFRHHQIANVEFIDDNSYARAYEHGFFRVTQSAGEHALELTAWTENPESLFALAQTVRRMFDLDADPLEIRKHLGRNDGDPILRDGVRQSPGLRLTRAYSPFEAVIGTVLGQLVSVRFARELMGDLINEYGVPVPGTGPGTPHPMAFAFPTAETLKNATMKKLRTTARRKEAIREIASLVSSGELNLGADADPQIFRARIRQIKGIGDWSAEYMSLRALGDPDAFPATDLILKRALDASPLLDAEVLRPWRGYVAIHLWHHYARQKPKTTAPPARRAQKPRSPRGTRLAKT